MKIISHRGNLNGPNNLIENNPTHIDSVLNLNFDVEIDLYYYKNKFYLGHDEPIYSINDDWLIERKNKLWVHLKTIELVENAVVQKLNYFWHENDRFTLTSTGIPWCYPGVYVKNGITVCLNRYPKIESKVLGICTDYVEDYI